MLNRSVVCVLVFSLSIVGCGKKNSKGSNDSSRTDGLAPGSFFVETYQMKINGCDTGEHTFQSASPATTRNQLCQALQDHALNNECAETSRKVKFSFECRGMTWTPVYAPVKPVTVRKPNLERSTDIKYLAGKTPDRFFITTLKVAHASDLIQQLNDCGVNFSGRICEDILYNPDDLIDPQTDKELYAFSIKEQGKSQRYVLAFDIMALPGKLQVPRLMVYEELLPFQNGSSLRTYLADPLHVKFVAEAELAADSIQAAIARIQSPRNLREFFGADYVLNSEGLAHHTEIKKTLKNFNLDLILQEKDSVQVRKILARLMYALTHKEMLAVAEKLESSVNPVIQIDLAGHLLQVNPMNVLYRELVNENLPTQSNYLIRVAYLSALKKLDTTFEEEMSIIGAMSDHVDDVQTKANEVVSSFLLTIDHLPALKKVSESHDYQVRRRAVKQIARIKGQSAQVLLLQTLNDSVDAVSQETFSILNQGDLGPELLPHLKPSLTSSDYRIRLNGIELLKKMKGDEVTLQLIALCSDNVELVSSLAFRAAGDRNLGEFAIKALVEVSQSSNYSIRLKVMDLVSQISGRNATAILIDLAQDNVDPVSAQAHTLLLSRNLTENELPALRRNIQNYNYGIRKNTAILLGKMKLPEAKAILKTALEVENVEEVIKEIERQLKN